MKEKRDKKIKNYNKAIKGENETKTCVTVERVQTNTSDALENLLPADLESCQGGKPSVYITHLT